jgi:hypothetical protein
VEADAIADIASNPAPTTPANLGPPRGEEATLDNARAMPALATGASTIQ